MDLIIPRQGSAESLDVGSVSTNPTTISSLQSSEQPTIKFTTYKALLEAIKQASTECIYIKDISAEQFTLVQRERGDKTPFRLKFFCPDQHLLIITIPSMPHEVVIARLERFFITGVVAQGLDLHWIGLNSTTYINQNNGTAGEGDASGGPFIPGVGAVQHWPTLVIESGYSQTLTQLRAQMAWWFRASAHQVKIVLLLKMDASSPADILIEKWQEIPLQNRPGATNTRASGALGPNLIQVINIRRINNAAPHAPQSYTVTRGDLRLDFALLFLRQPGQGEGDIIIGIQQLQWLGATLAGINLSG
ncbi:unnamed protein product [Clonostachys rosea f. rosea IK726]|uniref:Uncharacterized protein n=2 Tax=Bionectria ochroleuca TaxID=29856 RepID=A0A0B7JVE9_BIOOC|nr:unnamed protein product [Clonostachys rosea f. rosea IK726]